MKRALTIIIGVFVICTGCESTETPAATVTPTSSQPVVTAEIITNEVITEEYIDLDSLDMSDDLKKVIFEITGKEQITQNDLNSVVCLKMGYRYSLYDVYHDVTDMTGLEYFRNLESISIDMGDIGTSSLLELNNLKNIDISGEGYNGDFDDITSLLYYLSNIDTLQYISIALYGHLDLSGFGHGFKNLEHLKISTFTDFQSLNNTEALQNLNKLRTLSIYAHTLDESDNDVISQLDNLEELYLFSCFGVQYKKYAEMENLTHFGTTLVDENEYGDVIYVDNADKLTVMKNIKRLDCSYNSFKDISALSELKQLEMLDLSLNHMLEDITPISELVNLQELNISRTQVSDIAALSTLQNLRLLDISKTEISDISVLLDLENLESVNITETKVKNRKEIISQLEVQGVEVIR